LSQKNWHVGGQIQQIEETLKICYINHITWVGKMGF